MTTRAMFVLSALLLSSWTSVVFMDPLTFDNNLLYFPPPYLQSNAEFKKASRYLLQRLPLEGRPVWNSEARRNFGFGVIVGIAKELSYAIRPQHPPQRYQAPQILSKYVPHARDEYNNIVNETKNLLREANMKIEPVVTIIEALCMNLEEVTCDRKIQIFIKRARYIKRQAELLLQLGSVSKRINGFTNTFDSLAEDGQEIPFLQHHVDDPYVRNLMKELYKTYSLIHEIK